MNHLHSSRRCPFLIAVAATTLCIACAFTSFGQTNQLESSTNAVPKVNRIGYFPRLTNALLASNAAVKLPEQGPWTLSSDDLRVPLFFAINLVKPRTPIYSFLWNSLSTETQAALSKTAATSGIYTAGPEIGDLIADLNKLVRGRLIYSDKYFGELELSGDTLQLLKQMPVGADVAHLNRLLLEDAFAFEIMPRPKILKDPVSKRLVFLDFKKRAISLYAPNGKRLWNAVLPELDQTRDKVSVSFGRDSPWDVSFTAQEIVIILREEGGYTIIRMGLKTGHIIFQGHV